MPKKITQNDKDTIENLYLNEQLTPKEIHEKAFKDTDIKVKSISNYIVRNNLKSKREQIKAKINENIENKIITDKTNKFNVYNEKDINNFNDLEIRIKNLLLEFSQEDEDIRAGKKKKRNIATPKNAQILSEALLNIQKGRRTALGMDNGKNSPSDDSEPKITVINGLDITRI